MSSLTQPNFLYMWFFKIQDERRGLGPRQKPFNLHSWLPRLGIDMLELPFYTQIKPCMLKAYMHCGITGYHTHKLYTEYAMASDGSLLIITTIYACASHSGSGGLGSPALTDGQVPCHPNILPFKHTHTRTHARTHTHAQAYAFTKSARTL